MWHPNRVSHSLLERHGRSQRNALHAWKGSRTAQQFVKEQGRSHGAGLSPRPICSDHEHIRRIKAELNGLGSRKARGEEAGANHQGEDQADLDRDE